MPLLLDRFPTKIEVGNHIYCMRKKCCKCKKELLTCEFKSNSKRKDGLQSQCIQCQKEYRRQHYLQNRQKYIDKAANVTANFRKWWKEYKKRFACSKCGENHPACIQFHHNGNKEGNVSWFVGNGSKEDLLKEIEKCTILCANCHFKEHWKE